MLKIQRGLDGQSIILFTDSTRTVVSSNDIIRLRMTLEYFEKELDLEHPGKKEIEKKYLLTNET